MLGSISSNYLRASFLLEHRFGSFSSYMYIEKAAKTTFVQKMRAKNVDDFDTKCLGMLVSLNVKAHFVCQYIRFANNNNGPRRRKNWVNPL